MGEICKTMLFEYIIEGIGGDYIFETIKSKNDFYEETILRQWLFYIKDSKVIFDIGANLGNHTLFWAKSIRYDKIYSFEPHPINYQLLSNNIRNNHLKNIFAINTGVGEKRGFTSISEFDENNYGGTRLDVNIQSEGDIPIIDIDSFVEEEGITSMDFVKIDTEGFEKNVLIGMSKVIEIYHPDFWIEVGEDTFKCVMEFLYKNEYILVDVIGFNMLFLYIGRHPEAKEVEQEKILEAVFTNLTKVNHYYKDYTTAKKWIKDKEEKISYLDQKFNDEKQKNNALTENYDRMKAWYNDEKQKNNALTENYDRVKAWHENDLSKLQNLQNSIENFQNKLQKSQDEIQDLQNKLQQQHTEIQDLNDKIQAQQSKIKEQREAYERLKQWRLNDQQKLIDVIKAEHQQVLVMQKAKKIIKKQQFEIQVLHAENDSYKRKMSIINDTWYGKLALRCYNMLKRARRRLVRK